MADKDYKNVNSGEEEIEKQYSLNDDRRVKVLSPGMMVAKRFFRNRMAMVGLIVLILMFVFSFIGGLITPYGEDELFYRTDYLQKEFASAIKNEEYRYLTAEGQSFPSMAQARLVLAMNIGEETFEYDGINYKLIKEADDLYLAALEDGTVVGAAYKMVFSTEDSSTALDFDTQVAGLKAYSLGEKEFTAGDVKYKIDEHGSVSTEDGEPFGYISEYVVQPLMGDVFLTRDFKEKLIAELEAGSERFVYNEELPGDEAEETTQSADETAAADEALPDDIENANANPDAVEAEVVEREYLIKYSPSTKKWTITQATATRVYDSYSKPSLKHWLGTDKNGMDMLTRLMYGGRVSLLIGFVVEIISTVIGIILGGISGYFGGWVDNLIMRIVDIFYCIPMMPIVIIIGAAMDSVGVKPKLRMLYLMLILGVLSWPSMARLIRGQILSLREQEFMTATEASGLSVRRRIFHHLIPNVVPQMIVSVTMGLGGTILTESSLSFLGLGVRFPFASWGNIINDVNDTYVLKNFWFIWIPAGVLLLLTVLAFNIVGDGLRDAFDPKMKR